MADQPRDYEDNRGRSRRDWNDRANDERRARFGNDEPRRFGDERFGDKRQRFGDYERPPYQSAPRDDFWRGEEPEAWRRGEGDSFGGQRPYARDLYSDSGRSRHETDWSSGNAGRGMQSVYSRPSHAGPRYGFSGRGPKDYQRSDERIREEICDRMTDDDSLDPSDITIQVTQGEVTLTGTVQSRYQKRRAEDLAEGSSGVRDVTNNIRIAREQEPLDLNQSPSIRVS